MVFQKPTCISKQQWFGRKYCSVECVGKANSKKFTGRIISKEWRDKLSRAKIGNSNATGAKRTEEMREKNRLAHLGTKSHFYKDGRSLNRKEYYRIKSLERYAQKLKAEGMFTVKEWQELKCRHEYRCVFCGKLEPEIKLTKDHIIPLTKGGSNWITNIQPLCGSCNSRKNNRVGNITALNN